MLGKLLGLLCKPEDSGPTPAERVSVLETLRVMDQTVAKVLENPRT
ncbi:MAG: hypothetical protein LC650_00525 [Actinobacteria bacterium]|nr:hypothetical protein [Actinomycetota bacterium]